MPPADVHLARRGGAPQHTLTTRRRALAAVCLATRRGQVRYMAHKVPLRAGADVLCWRAGALRRGWTHFAVRIRRGGGRQTRSTECTWRVCAGTDFARFMLISGTYRAHLMQINGALRCALGAQGVGVLYGVYLQHAKQTRPTAHLPHAGGAHLGAHLPNGGDGACCREEILRLQGGVPLMRWRYRY